MSRFSYILLGAVSLLIISCESVIDIPLNDADVRVVVDAQIRDSLGDNYVRLSRTGSVYASSNFPKISGADVSISDGTTTYILEEDPLEPGKYTDTTLKAMPNTTYNLTIDIDGQIITAQSTTFDSPSLTELYYEPQYNFFSEFDPSEPDTIYQVFYNYPDNVAQTNFYQIRAWVSGDEDRTFYIFDDKLYNGENNIAPLWGAYVISGDTVDVELLSMDKARYKYLFTLASAGAAGPGAPAPANPESNIEGDAIGYFSAFTTDTLSIVIP